MGIDEVADSGKDSDMHSQTFCLLCVSEDLRCGSFQKPKLHNESWWRLVQNAKRPGGSVSHKQEIESLTLTPIWNV